MDCPLKILVDIRPLRPDGEGGGIKPVLIELFRWLPLHLPGGSRIIYAVSTGADFSSHGFIRPDDSVVDVTQLPPGAAALLGCDLVYGPFGITDLACPGIPTLTLVVDLLHRDYPRTLPLNDQVYREEKFAAAVRVSDRFQVISDFTASRLTHHYPQTQGRIFRTYLPIHGRLKLTGQSLRLWCGHSRFFLYPANFWFHKNHETLIQAYSLYRAKSATPPWPLILTGHPHPGRIEQLTGLCKSLGVAADVIFAGYVSDEELAGYFNSAGALVFPSQHEGFGLPIMEAMAFGLPIIANNAGVVSEIIGPAGLLVDASDPEALAGALLQVANDATLRQRLIDLGDARLKLFSAEREFLALLVEMATTARRPARWRRTGYYAIDGVTDPVAVFELPEAVGEVLITVRTKPFFAARTLRMVCGSERLLEAHIPINQAFATEITLHPSAKALVIQVPDAASESATDHRTHGVLLDALHVRTPDGQIHDLLAGPDITETKKTSAPPPPPVGNAKLFWHIEIGPPTVPCSGVFEVRGWCFGEDVGPINLSFRVGGALFRTVANLPRPDVVALHHNCPSEACGFRICIFAPPGTHELKIEANLAGQLQLLASYPVTTRPLKRLRAWLSARNASSLPRSFVTSQMHEPKALVQENFPPPGSAAGTLPALTVVTPSFEQADFLEETLTSVIQQLDPRHGQYVVQDGGSRDGSLETIRRHRKHLRAWTSGPDRGQTDAILTGFAKTGGAPEDIMAWINSDDFYLPGALAYVAGYFARHPEVDVVYGHRVLVDENSREIGRWFLPPHDDEVLRLNDFVPQETMFWRRRIWDKVGGIDPSFKFAMDWDLLLRFQAAGAKIVRVPYFLACFRIHSAQKTSAQMESVGQREIDALRLRTFGRVLSPTELESHPRLLRYLRKSAWIEFLWGRFRVRHP